MQNPEVIKYRQRMLQQTIPNFSNLCVYHFTTKVRTLDMIRTCIKRSKSVVDYCPNIINSENVNKRKIKNQISK